MVGLHVGTEARPLISPGSSTTSVEIEGAMSAWVQIPVLLLISFLSLDRSPNFSLPQFPHSQNEKNKNTNLYGLV